MSKVGTFDVQSQPVELILHLDGNNIIFEIPKHKHLARYFLSILIFCVCILKALIQQILFSNDSSSKKYQFRLKAVNLIRIS